MGVQNENNILDQNSSLNCRFYGWILFIHVRSIHLEHLKIKLKKKVLGVELKSSG